MKVIEGDLSDLRFSGIDLGSRLSIDNWIEGLPQPISATMSVYCRIVLAGILKLPRKVVREMMACMDIIRCLRLIDGDYTVLMLFEVPDLVVPREVAERVAFVSPGMEKLPPPLVMLAETGATPPSPWPTRLGFFTMILAIAGVGTFFVLQHVWCVACSGEEGDELVDIGSNINLSGRLRIVIICAMSVVVFLLVSFLVARLMLHRRSRSRKAGGKTPVTRVTPPFGGVVPNDADVRGSHIELLELEGDEHLEFVAEAHPLHGLSVSRERAGRKRVPKEFCKKTRGRGSWGTPAPDPTHRKVTKMGKVREEAKVEEVEDQLPEEYSRVPCRETLR